MSLQVFERIWRVTVGTLQLTQNDIQFKVKKTLKPEPNTCQLRMWNLTVDHRKQIEQQASRSQVQTNPQIVPVRIEAGYGTTLAQIFLGNVRAGSSVTDGPQIITELTTGDGERSLQLARLNTAFGPGTPISTVVSEIVAVLGLGQGNLSQALATLQTKGQLQFSAKGQVLKGNCADHMTDLCKSAGLEWSIQDGNVQVLTLGQPLNGQAIFLDADHGLVGSPSVDSKGLLKCQTRLIPGIKPGVLISLASEHIVGGYRIAQCEYIGETKGTDWSINIEANKY